MSPPEFPLALAHGSPFRHAAESNPLLVIVLVFLGFIATVGAGILLGERLKRDPRLGGYAAALSAGALLFLFFDLLKEAASLGQGLVQAPLLQVGFLVLFAAGTLLIPAFSGGGSDPQRVAWLWTLGIAAHSAGEGWVVGTEATNADLLAPLQASSFLLHKAIEGLTIPVVAAASSRLDAWPALAGLVAAASLVAALGGYLLGPSLLPLLLFGAGGGAAAYAILRLGAVGPSLSLRHTLAAVVGVIAVYAAGVLHEL